jgi:hypothetical protein
MKRRRIPGYRFALGFHDGPQVLKAVQVYLHSWSTDLDGTILLTRQCTSLTEWESAVRELRVGLQKVEQAGRNVFAKWGGLTRTESLYKPTSTEKLRREIIRLEEAVHITETYNNWRPRDFLGTP